MGFYIEFDGYNKKPGNFEIVDITSTNGRLTGTDNKFRSEII
jgi:hypothetical protein